MKMKKTMTMKNDSISDFTVQELFDLQSHLQNIMFDKKLPTDSIEDFKYSILALISELGEVLDADRRWKNVRKKPLEEPDKKLDELCDCMAFLINAILYSGFSSKQFIVAFLTKNYKNIKRYIDSQIQIGDENNDSNS